ncbi:MAG: hypothetical protein ACRDFB_03100, partial [Rhabdochlamydiaceae bacterium]
MAILNSMPLFLQSQKFSEVKDKLLFYEYSEIGYLSRVIELVKAAFCACTHRSTVAWEHCQNVWTGYKADLRKFDPKEVHQWKLLLKTNFQKQFYLQSQEWEGVLTKCPETFEFAPLEVKKNEELASCAVLGNAAMIQFVDKELLKESFVKQLAEKTPHLVLFLEKSLREKVVETWTPEQKAKIAPDSRTGISALQAEQLEYVVNSCRTVWQDCLNNSFAETHFLYLRRGKIGSPHTIQIFKDGKTWIHVHDACIGFGTAKVIRLINEWNTKKQFAKLSIRTKGLIIVMGGEERLKKEISFHEMLKGQRGIVQLVDTFAYPTKNVKKSQGQKTILVQERYSFSLDNKIPLEVINKWTEKDIQQLTLDLLYGLKAFKDNNLYDGDFSFGNVLMQLDEEGHIVKAGFTDFEQAEVLTEKSRKEFRDPLDPDHEIPTKVI